MYINTGTIVGVMHLSRHKQNRMRKHAFPSNHQGGGRSENGNQGDEQGRGKRVKFRSNQHQHQDKSNFKSNFNLNTKQHYSHPRFQNRESVYTRKMNESKEFQSNTDISPKTNEQAETTEQDEQQGFRHVSGNSFMIPKATKYTKPQPASKMRVSDNPYAMMDTDDDDEEETHTHTSKTHNTTDDETQANSTNQVVSPLTILEPYKQTRKYPIEPIEGLLLLGLLSVPPLPSDIREIFNKYTDKCKKIHQQYVEQYRKNRRGPNLNRNQPHRKYQGQQPRNRNKGRKQELTGEDFALIRDFKKTEIVRDEEGVAKTKAKIRASLNKLTDKTYEKMNAQIHEEMKQMIDSGASTEDYHELSHFVFDVASSNRFYGKLYADLFVDMVKEYDFLKVSMNYQLKEFLNTMTTVEVASPDDYDRFCEVNKQNEKRRALSSFMGHLLRIDCIEGDLIGNMIHELVSKSIEWIRMVEGEQAHNRVCVEEVAEVVFAFLETAGIQATDLNMWEPILSKCIAITEMKRTNDNALTSKAKFKYMDVLDMIKKWQV